MERINKNKVVFILLAFFSAFPLLRFNISSFLIILITAVAVITSISSVRITINKNSLFLSVFIYGYLGLLYASAFYSTNLDEALKRIIQSLPLFISPFLVIFGLISLTNRQKHLIINLFVLANVVFSIVVLFIFLFNYHKEQYDLMHYVLDYDKFQFIVNQSIENDLIFMHKAYFSMSFVFSCIYLLNHWFATKNYSKRIIYMFIIVYLSVWIFYAFSFPNVLAYLISAVILLYLKLNYKVFIPTVVILLLLLGAIASIKFKDSDFRRGVSFVQSYFSNEDVELKDAREVVYSIIGNVLDESDIKERLIGYGVGDVKDLLNSKYESSYNSSKKRNLLFYNDQFDNQYWFKNFLDVKRNKEFAPNGELKAEFIYSTGGDTIVSHNLSAKGLLANLETGIFTLSVHAKRASSKNLILRLGTMKQRAHFNLESGKVINSFETLDADIIEMDDNWYRCFITTRIKSEDLNAIIGISSDNGKYLFSSTEKGIYLWGVQLEEGNLNDYSGNNSEILKRALDNRMNSHNQYLHILLCIGALGLIVFILNHLYLLRVSILRKDILLITFVVILLINFFTENILVRQWGLNFYFLIFVALFPASEDKTNANDKAVF